MMSKSFMPEKLKSEVLEKSYFFSTDKPVEFEVGVPAAELENFLKPGGWEGMLRDFCRTVINFLTNFLGVSFVIVPPAGLQGAEPNLWPLLRKIDILKERGFVGELRRGSLAYHDEPRLTLYYLPASRDRSLSGSSGVGKSFHDDEQALGAAFGEAVERISLRNKPAKLLKGRHKQVKNSIDPLSFAGIAPENRERLQNSPDFLKYHNKLKLTINDNSVFEWVRCQSFLSGGKFYIPAQLVYLTHDHRLKEPLIRFGLSTGAAAGRTLNEAILVGALEVIERDAFMITWINQISPDKLSTENLPLDIQEIFDKFSRYHLELHILSLPTDLEVSVFLGIAIDRTGIGPAIAVATKADFDLHRVVEAVAEDLVSHRIALRRSTEKGLPDLKHLTLDNRSYNWFGREKIKDIEFLLRGKEKKFEEFENQFSEALACESTEGRLEFLKHKIKELGYDAYWVSILPKKMKDLDVYAVNVIIPQMQPLYVDECLPYHDGKRLKSVPEKFGFTPSSTSPSVAHPFA